VGSGGDCGGDDLYEGGGDGIASAEEDEVVRRACGGRGRGLTIASCGADALYSCTMRTCCALSLLGFAGRVVAPFGAFFFLSWSVDAAFLRHSPSCLALPHREQWLDCGTSVRLERERLERERRCDRRFSASKASFREESESDMRDW
jgi:hypothetical protein